MGLGDASRVLGVNESTLRRWADNGLVRMFRTPGGHRRFSAKDLQRLMDAGGGDIREFDDEALRRIRERLEDDGGAAHPWMATMAPEVRAELGSLGRETVSLVEQYLNSDANDAVMQTSAAGLGERYAVLLQSAGVSLTDAVAAFAYFRRGMDQAVRSFAQSHGMTAEAAGGLWERVSVLEDHVLVALTGAFEHAAAPRESTAPTTNRRSY